MIVIDNDTFKPQKIFYSLTTLESWKEEISMQAKNNISNEWFKLHEKIKILQD